MISQYCTFELGSMLLGVEARDVQEVLRTQPLTQVPLAPEFVRGLMNLRGQIVLVIDLRQRLGVPDEVGGAKPINVLVKTNTGLVSVQADRISDVLELDSNAIDAVPETLQSNVRDVLLGAFRLPHRLLLLLNPERIAYSTNKD